MFHDSNVFLHWCICIFKCCLQFSYWIATFYLIDCAMDGDLMHAIIILLHGHVKNVV
jgi:hypothetical protein